ncbi:Hypothetical predicted protein [Paramuricea clavata]|uniref:Uncharacterized protein n=1 Tax=Paramuricea clavata TaxID=317549 RepID=A0A6S7HG12_PARCT|nr:Hypothetical predicted protein [Paramuricea clavata]
MNPALYQAEKQQLKLKNNSVPRFTLKGKQKYAKVVSVYDGDTCDLVFYEDEHHIQTDKPVRYKCRMLGYDAPELEEKPSGELARGYLTYLCTGGNANTYNAEDENLRTERRVQRKLDNNKDSLVYAVFGGPGKYGRQLVTLYQTSHDPPTNPTINTMMAQYINTLP